MGSSIIGKQGDLQRYILSSSWSRMICVCVCVCVEFTYSDRHAWYEQTVLNQIKRRKRLIRVYIVDHAPSNFTHIHKLFVDEKYMVRVWGVNI